MGEGPGEEGVRQLVVSDSISCHAISTCHVRKEALSTRLGQKKRVNGHPWFLFSPCHSTAYSWLITVAFQPPSPFTSPISPVQQGGPCDKERFGFIF